MKKGESDKNVGDEENKEDIDKDKDPEKTKRKHRVLVHCMAGISRSSTITISYLMKYKNMKYQDAYNHVRERREIISPNYHFVEQLKEWEKSIFPEDVEKEENEPGAPRRSSLALPTKVKKNINVRPPFEGQSGK